MQRLKVKTRDAQGREEINTVTVIRSWTDASGLQIHLHSSGVYGYKDGSPVRSKADLEAIPQEDHREMALAWWSNGGKKMSDDHYRAAKERQKARLSDFSVDAAQPASELDQVMYHRYPAAGSKPKDLPAACAWMQYFPRRPDWWGQAEKIELPEWTYEKAIPAKTRKKIEDL